MELRHLRYFVAVADKLHFGHAAAGLNTSQPSLSQQIRNLERELRVELFVRSKRSVALTKAGQRFLKEARSILASAERAAQIARRAEHEEDRRLIVGISPETSWQFLRPVLREVREHLPSVEVIFQILASAEQANALREETIDVGFVSLPLAAKGIESESIQRVPLRIALSSRHPLARRRRIALKDLSQEPHTVCLDFAPTLRDETAKRFSDAGFGRPVPLEGGLPSLRTTLGMAAAGLTIALVDPESQLSTPGVVFRDLEEPILMELGVIYRSGDESTVLSSFLGFVREASGRRAAPKRATSARHPKSPPRRAARRKAG